MGRLLAMGMAKILQLKFGVKAKENQDRLPTL